MSPIVSGTDFSVVAEERLRMITGFFDRSPG
jgi:hypothetical protein